MTMSRMPRSVLTVAAALIAAAGVFAAPADASPSPAGTGAPVLHFHADGSTSVEGVIESGRPVQIDFDPARLSKCRGTDEYGDSWGISVQYRIDGGQVRVYPVTARVTADGTDTTVRSLGILQLRPDTRHLQMWFVGEDRTGCHEEDTDHGANYQFDINQPPVLARATYQADWSETLTGSLRQGGALVIDYDPARLPQCRTTYRGYPAWQIDAFYRFDGGPVRSTPVNQGAEAIPIRIDVPANAQQIETWFTIGVPYPPTGCSAYDSDYGKNYTFSID
ncbi:DUF6209 family protein [Actinoplanes teichomyceticus]|uniref:Secreted protein n=1 Tax=Actinoplanes teichomyceticus TaxID=1867 RepID=A0A561VIH6_ACTTI|nr:DUF6209 family protein [Actinoplanes teichomyceticus]TWG11412.1 hypothetical protein FHX34_106142 [Actinoplanes teichomyceticus]GIF15776.1 hypothetical protein Ate01nite_58080 [Actinoplanes teichomyceticus]